VDHTPYTTDWLSADTVYYNTVTKKISRFVNDVIDFSNIELDDEGLHNYMLFGYSVFGATPVKNVRFLPPSSSIRVDESNEIRITSGPDEGLEKPVGITEARVWELLKSKVETWSRSVDGEIIIPTSGGFDSRILNALVPDKSRIRSFTYGISEKQSDSYEVVYARKVSEILGTRWEQVLLGDYNRYLDDWNRVYGPATHAHGMYHIEFYNKIRPKVSGGNGFLSGIIGDAWSGKVQIPEIHSVKDVLQLGYSHGISIPEVHFQKRSRNLSMERYFEEKREQLKDPDYRIIESMRMKIILLNYLMRIPEHFGFKPWSPFLEKDVVLAMLNLPADRKKDRQWQTDFLTTNGLLVESMDLRASKKNELDLLSIRSIPLQPLDENTLREVVKIDFVHWINRKIAGLSVLDYLSMAAALMLGKAGIKLWSMQNPKIQAYNYYMILWPLQKILEQRKSKG
jgi:hypothetical protein